MRVSRLMPAAIAAVLAAAPAAAADALVLADAPDREVIVLEQPDAAAGDTTVVYVFPTSPQTFVPMAGLPSFLFMPGAPLPEIATEVRYSMAVPAAALPAVIPGDIDCDQILGEVLAPAPDPYHLDRDGDGVGCEPEDR